MGISHKTPKITPSPGTPLVATPKTPSSAKTSENPSQTPESSSQTDKNLTDNLLQINLAKRTRLKAQDFFK